MKCPRCGTENPDERMYCEGCGILLPTPKALKQQKIADGFLAFAVVLGVIVLYLGSMTLVSLVWQAKFLSETAGSYTEAEFMEAFNRDSGYINIIFSGVCLLLAAVFYGFQKRSLIQVANIYPARPFKISTAFVAGLTAQLPLGFIVALIPFSEEVFQGHEEFMTASTTPILVQILYSVVLAPIIEEVFFRGIAHDRLARAMPPFLASLISSAAFAVIHGELLAMIAAFAAGLMLSLLYNRYKTILVPIAFHMGFNVLAYVVPYVTNEVVQIVLIGVSAAVFALSLVILFKKDKKPKTEISE